MAHQGCKEELFLRVVHRERKERKCLSCSGFSFPVGQGSSMSGWRVALMPWNLELIPSSPQRLPRKSYSKPQTLLLLLHPKLKFKFTLWLGKRLNKSWKLLEAQPRNPHSAFPAHSNGPSGHRPVQTQRVRKLFPSLDGRSCGGPGWQEGKEGLGVFCK